VAPAHPDAFAQVNLYYHLTAIRTLFQNLGAPVTDASWKHGASDGEIYTLVKDGSKNTGMKGYASKMTAQEMWSVVNYLKTLSAGK